MHPKYSSMPLQSHEGTLERSILNSWQTQCGRLPHPATHRRYSLVPLQSDKDTLEGLNVQNLANTVWALATASHASQ
eukprot:299540-Karenia_brevis.AAC.1